MNRTSTKFSFANGRGQTLAGVIDAPAEGAPLFYGVFAPCFTCVKDAHGAAKICRAMAEAGAAMLRFDMTGLGQSEGDFAHTTFTTRIADIVAAARALEAQYEPPRLLVGHSISGTAALSAVHQLPSVEVLATVGSPHDAVSSIDKYFRQGLISGDAADNDMIMIDVLGRPTPFHKSFVDDMRAQDVAADTARVTQDLLVFHAPNDAVVEAADARMIYDRAAAARRREIVWLDEDATHLFENRKEDAQAVADRLMRQMVG